MSAGIVDIQVTGMSSKLAILGFWIPAIHAGMTSYPLLNGIEVRMRGL
jgi:hypothetical protein